MESDFLSLNYLYLLILISLLTNLHLTKFIFILNYYPIIDFNFSYYLII